MKIRKGSVTSPAGFLAAGLSCGLKRSGDLDLGLLVSETPSPLAAVFTRNWVKAAPVLRGLKLMARGSVRTFFVNSGCANACTGDDGLRDADEMAAAAAEAIGVSPDDVFVASTGKIGVRLEMEKIKGAATRLAEAVSAEDGECFARAIMTTDTAPKTGAVDIALSGGTVSIGGCAKGSGMISPSMATMLAFLTTDAQVARDQLQGMLNDAVADSFNKITVDAHMSTNDTAALIANGASGIGFHSREDRDAFSEGLAALCLHLAKAIVRDGEGASKLVEVAVKGALNGNDAERIARAIADSLLVKCAVNGADPNWGRVVSAAGYAGVPFNPEDLSLDIGTIRVFENGMPAEFNRGSAVDYMRGDEVRLVLSVGGGPGSVSLWTCDLSKAYVKINAAYTT